MSASLLSRLSWLLLSLTPLLAFTRYFQSPLHKTCPFPCLEVDLGLVGSSSAAQSSPQAEARSLGSPWVALPQTHLGSGDLFSAVPSLSARGHGAPGTFCLGPRPVGHVATRGTALHTLPITTEPSVSSFLFPSLIPFAFFLPHPAPPPLLVPAKGKSFCSRGFLESSGGRGPLAGGRRKATQQAVAGLEGTRLRPGDLCHLCWAAQPGGGGHPSSSSARCQVPRSASPGKVACLGFAFEAKVILL